METEMSLVLGIIAVLVLLFLTVLGLLIYSGLFTSFDIRAGQPPFQNLLVAYRFARGPYKNASELFTETHALAPQLRTIGVFYDDPQEVVPSDLRYVVGVILSEGEEEVNKEYEKLFVDRGYKLFTFPSVSHAVTTTFPFKNTFSVFIAVARVYPQLSEYIKTRALCAHPMLEVYENDHILFVAPLAKQDEFYVPEAKEENSDDDERASLKTDASPELPCERQAEASEGTKPEVLPLATGPKPEGGDDTLLTPPKSESGSPADDSAGSSFEELNMESQ